MNAIDASYHFAGVCGLSPKGWTLRQLWAMANGRIGNRRRENLELASLVWSLGEIDWESYLLYGEMTETGRGGPVQLTPELHARIEAEVERIRKENPDLPTIRKAE